MTNASDIDTGVFPAQKESNDPEAPRPLSARVQVDIAALSHTGSRRSNNEDQYYAGRIGRSIDTLLNSLPEGEIPDHFGETGYLVAVADGMGGAASGEVASSLAIRTLINIIIDAPNWILRLDEKGAEEVKRLADDYFRQVNEALLEKARQRPQLEGMGTTMTSTYSVGGDLFVAHAGDSRAYLFRNGKLQRLTHDQTQAQVLADKGLISQDDVATHRFRHILTNALGGTDKLSVDLGQFKLSDGDRVLLCTDGLTDMVKDKDIAGVMKDNSKSEATCMALVAKALQHGGHDNVTVAVTRYSIPSE